MKGQTLPCACCKGILLRFSSLKGEGSIELLCPHCDEINLVTATPKTTLTASKVIKLLLAFLIIFGAFHLFTLHKKIEHLTVLMEK